MHGGECRCAIACGRWARGSMEMVYRVSRRVRRDAPTGRGRAARGCVACACAQASPNQASKTPARPANSAGRHDLWWQCVSRLRARTHIRLYVYFNRQNIIFVATSRGVTIAAGLDFRCIAYTRRMPAVESLGCAKLLPSGVHHASCAVRLYVQKDVLTCPSTCSSEFDPRLGILFRDFLERKLLRRSLDFLLGDAVLDHQVLEGLKTDATDVDSR